MPVPALSTPAAPAAPTMTFVVESRLTLLSPLSHGGDSTGTNEQILNRRKYVQADGYIENVPILSGNGIRGQLRDLANEMFLELLGNPRLSPAALHFLFSGGSLTKGSSPHVLRIDQARRLRDLLPTVSLFGGGAGNQLHEGKLIVSEAIPFCEETAEYLPPDALAAYTPRLNSIYDHTERIGQTRIDDSKRERMQARLHPSVAAEYAPLLAQVAPPRAKTNPRAPSAPADEEEEEDGPKQQMRFYTETVCAGTVFWQQIVGCEFTRVEFAALLATLAAWKVMPYVGGKRAQGMGRIRLEHPRVEEMAAPGRALAGLLLPSDTAELAPRHHSLVTQEHALPQWAQAYRDWVHEHGDKTLALLGEIQ